MTILNKHNRDKNLYIFQIKQSFTSHNRSHLISLHLIYRTNVNSYYKNHSYKKNTSVIKISIIRISRSNPIYLNVKTDQNSPRILLVSLPK